MAPVLPISRSASRRLLALAVGASSLLLGSCREATEVKLTVRTNLPCGDGKDWKGVAVYVGKPGDDVETTSPTLVTERCDESGSVGSLVIVPSGAKDEAVGLRIVAGLSRNPEDCAKADYAGCVVARRLVRFSPHESLQLDVSLTIDCLSQGCSVDSTCSTGKCVGLEQVPAPPPDPIEIVGPSVRCGDDGVICGTTGDVCCLTVDTARERTFGDCRPAKDCPPTSTVLRCDDDSDCPGPEASTGRPSVCALSYSYADGQYLQPTAIALSDCRYAYHDSIGNTAGLALCEERNGCVDHAFPCIASVVSEATMVNPLPGYFWCPLSVP
jgi:hypothetical protein